MSEPAKWAGITDKIDTQRIALVVSYEGTRYQGFQRQRDRATVQGKLEEALQKLTSTFTSIAAAGRTDTGVHALGQVVAFTTTSSLPPRTFLNGLNYYLPQDIVVRTAYRVDQQFHPRRDAQRRAYRYAILNSAVPSPLERRMVLWIKHHLDAVTMNTAAKYLIGQRDFAPFTGRLLPGRSSVRHLYASSVRRHGELILIDMEGSAFLPGQIRRTAGALVQVGSGRMSIQAFRRLLQEGKSGSARLALPALGLCLVRVLYQELPAPPPEEWPHIRNC